MGDFLVKTEVLLAVYNGEKHLRALLDSLKAQTDPDFFVRFQDDGSTDSTISLLAAAAQEDPRFFSGTEPGRRFGPAGNFLSLIRQSDADCILLCDQDGAFGLPDPERGG